MAKTAIRTEHLKQALNDRRREIVDHVRVRVRSERDQGPAGIQDSVDAADATMQTEIDMALLEMQAATLARIDEAIARLDAGQYGSCFECNGLIAESRLKAMPFAVRCRACEEARETGLRQDRHVAARGATSLFHSAIY